MAQIGLPLTHEVTIILEGFQGIYDPKSREFISCRAKDELNKNITFGKRERVHTGASSRQDRTERGDVSIMSPLERLA
jgi:hypothetical protein